MPAAFLTAMLASACGTPGGRESTDPNPARRSNDAAATASEPGAAASDERAGGTRPDVASVSSGDGRGPRQSSLLAATFVVAPDASAIAPDPSDLSLPLGIAETLVTGIKGAEDILFSTDERLFVTANDGIYELKRDSSGQMQATNLHPGDKKCLFFTGILEIENTLYVACEDLTNSYLFATSLAGSPRTPVFSNIYTMHGTPLANEIAADPDGRIYVAESLQGKILRLQLSSTDPFTVAAQEVWLSTPGGIFPNGIKYIDSSIYWTDSLGGTINRASILPDGTPGPVSRFVATKAEFFDDLYVNSDGTVLVASYLSGTLRAYAGLLPALPYAETPHVFKNPADVLPAKGRFGFGDKDLLVADKGANSVVVFHLPF
jgi:hypothetical protein